LDSQAVIKGLFFDLDGTLCGTYEANYAAYAQAFAEEGHELTHEAFAIQKTGLRSDQFIPRIVPGASPETVQRIIQAKTRHYEQAMHLLTPNHRLIEFIHLNRPTHTLALVTTARRANGLRVLQALGLHDAFHATVFGDEVEHAKPHPQAYLKALADTGLQASQVIAFEDSSAGIKAATSAGIKTIKVQPVDGAHEGTVGVKQP
jgi:beta-phosphoglucomutase